MIDSPKDLAHKLKEEIMREAGIEPRHDLTPGETQCPACGKAYMPELGERKHPELMIQDEFPDPPMPGGPAEAWRLACKRMSTLREQYLSGLCSQPCWEQFVGKEETEPYDEEEEV